MPLQVAISLRELRRLVDKVAEEEEVVLRRNGEGVAHESRGVDDKGARHLARDPT